MKLSTKYIALLAGLAFSTAGVVSTQASSSTINFSVDMSVQIGNSTFNPSGGDTVYVQGTFNGWNPFIQLFQQGSSSVFTNSFVDTTEANGGVTKYQYVRRPFGGSDVYETSADFNLRAARLPSVSGGSVTPPTPFFNDAAVHTTNSVTFQCDVSQQIALGNFTNGTSTIEVRGNFNGWGSAANLLTLDQTIRRTNQYGLVTSNVYVTTISGVNASTNGAMDFKYVIQPGLQWDSPASTSRDNGGNRFFTMPNSALVLPAVDFSDAPYAPLSQIKFSVDMTAVKLGDPNYDPTSVTINGDFNGWSAGVACTNDVAAANTNIYSAVLTSGAGSSINYQFRYQAAGNTVYDNKTGGGNRYLLVPNASSTNLPAVYFNDVNPADVLSQDTTVNFTVSMTNAVGTDSHVYTPGDYVFINGDFVGWVNWAALDLATATPTLQCVNDGSGNMLFTYSRVFSKGHARSVKYKYSINGADNEAASGTDRYRYIRGTNGTYNMPMDKFSLITVEPKYGIAVGSASGGSVPINYLGFPGVKLQTSTNLTTWTDVLSTDGQGQATTNWPATGGPRYFRTR